MIQVFHGGGIRKDLLDPTQELIVRHRAARHCALLHNQPRPRPEDWQDTRIDESEIILDALLRHYQVLNPDEAIEEIAMVEPAEGTTSRCLVIQTERQAIYIASN